MKLDMLLQNLANLIQKAVNEIIKEFGRIDGLVNNAGINDGIGLENGNYDFLSSIKNNLAHYYKMAQLVLPELKKNKGSIVNIGSKVSSTGQGGTLDMLLLTEVEMLLQENGLLNYTIFRVNSVIVAECLTPLYKKWINQFENPDKKLKSIENNIPLEKRMTTVEEIAKLLFSYFLNVLISLFMLMVVILILIEL